MQILMFALRKWIYYTSDSGEGAVNGKVKEEWIRWNPDYTQYANSDFQRTQYQYYRTIDTVAEKYKEEIKQMTDPELNVTKYEYPLNPTTFEGVTCYEEKTIVDPTPGLNITTKEYYDMLDRLVGEIDAEGNKKIYTY